VRFELRPDEEGIKTDFRAAITRKRRFFEAGFFVLGATTRAQLSAPASLGNQARAMMNGADNVTPNALDSITRQYTNGQAGSIFGALPPAP